MSKLELQSQSDHKTLMRIMQQTLQAMKPPPNLKIDEWADLHRRLSPESSAEPGLWSTDRAAYQRGMMQAISDPRIENIVFYDRRTNR